MRSPLNRLIAFALLLPAMAGCGRSATSPTADRPPDDSSATRKSWQDAAVITRRGQSEVAAGDPSVRSLRKMSSSLSDAAKGLQALPVLGVDEEVVGYLARRAEAYARAATLVDEMTNLGAEAQMFVKNANSFGAMMESFVYGLALSPLTPINNFKSGRDDLVRRERDILARVKTLKDQSDRLDTEEVALRAKLSRRYGIEFEALETAPDAAQRTFSAADQTAVRERLAAHSERLGGLLVNGTHPTGKYSSAGLPEVSRSSDGRELNVSIPCFWSGVSGKRYQTTYGFSIGRTSGVDNLRVVSDTAQFKVDEAHRAATEERLRAFYQTLP